ncbi:MAG: HAD hydrolase-like protein [Kiritimatiellae bacterium]|nr:HAD hydrolase-like protein [Kiritimatiellia bacterium]
MSAHHTATAEPQPSKEQPAAPQTPEPLFAVLIELEGVAFNGRKAAYELLRDALKEQRIDFSPTHFSRHCLLAAPDFYVANLLEALGAKKTSAEKFIEDIKSGLDMFYASSQVKLDKHVLHVIEEARKRNIAVGVLSALPRETASMLMSRLGLKEQGGQLFTFDDVEAEYPRADTWLKIAKAMSKSPRACVVFAGDAQSCRAALAAGMHCVALPDEFTAFQDFGGADMVLDDLGEMAPGELLDAVLPRVP